MKLTIEAEKGSKGRSFSVDLLSYAVCDGLWDGGSTPSKNKRPVWMVLGGSVQESRAFVANLLMGRVAASEENRARFEIMKSAGYTMHTRSLGGGVVTSVYLRHLFSVDHGLIDTDGVRFILLASSSRVQGLPQMEGALFLSMLDKRTRYPMPQDPAFGLLLLNACLKAGIATRSSHWEQPVGRYNHSYDGSGAFGFYVHNPAAVNVGSALAFNASHEVFGTVLAETIKTYFEDVCHGA